jgi:hypothetical protein
LQWRRRSASAAVLLVLSITTQIVVEPLTAQQPQVPIPTAQELDQLLAPIALYPDALVAQITAASTNPQEILDVAAWREQNSGLAGDALVNAAQQQGFDPAFIALLNFPTVLDMMAQNIDDYAAIGAAFSANQAGVMDSIQRLRAQAYASGALRSTPQLQVQQQPQGTQQVIVIQPVNPQVVYVPVYDPVVVYGGPSTGMAIGSLITFGAGIAIGASFGSERPWGWGGWGWNWGRRSVIVNHNVWVVNNRYRPRRYTYRPRPVPYASRPGYRGSWGRPGNRPVNNRPGAPNRPGGTYRPNPNYRPGGNNRPGNNNGPGRPTTRPGPTTPQNRPAPNTRPGNQGNRPAPTQTRPTARPAPNARPVPSTRPANPYAGFSPGEGGNAAGPRPSGGRPSAFGGGSSGQAERAASARGQRSMGASRGSAPKKP